MSDKEFLERMLSMLPEEFQDIYDDTIPEAKEVRKKMGKKTSSAPSYSCAMPMLDDIRSLLTSSLRHPKILIKEFSYFLMPCHQHGLRINLLV